MSQELFDLDLSEKSVMDMGCGTGVLAIISKKLGAAYVEGVDIEEWAFENSLENGLLNDVSEVKFFQGDSDLIVGKSFDVILANINRNILLRDMQRYSNALSKNGFLLLSGFYTTDIEVIIESGKKSGLNFVHSRSKNGWAMVQLTK